MTNIPNDLQRTLNQGKARLNLVARRAALGDSQGNMNTLAMAVLNLYYVRYLTTNGYSTPGIARGPYVANVPLRPNQAVLIGRDTSGQDYILSADYETVLAGGGNPVPVPPPPSGKPYVTQDQLVTLRSSQYLIQPSLKVSVSGWKPIVNGIMYNFPGSAAYDLTSLVPGSGHAVVLLALKSDFVTLEAFASASIATNDALTDGDVNNALAQMTSGSTAIWAYDVPTGATQILDSMTLLDCRGLWNIGTNGAITFPLSVLQGGTGETFLAANSFLIGNGANPILTLPFPLPVLDGGTGETYLPSHGLLIGNNISPVGSLAPGANGNVATSDGTNWKSAPPTGGGSGTVTSVALTAAPSSIFDVSGSPITGSGTLALSMDNQSANTVLAGPSSGSAAAPAFRALVAADLPGGTNITVTTQSLYSEVLLYDNTLGADGSWDVSSLDQTYDHLKLIVTEQLETGNDRDFAITWINNDTTGANYKYARINGGSTNPAAGSTGAFPVIGVGTATGSNYFAMHTVFIPAYTNALNKEWIAESTDMSSDGTTTFVREIYQVKWANTAAINRLTVIPSTAGKKFKTGSRLQIIGIKAITVVTGVTGAGTVQFTGGASKTVSNTASETTLVATVTGTQTLSAGALSEVGRQLRIEAWGYISDLLTPTLELKFKLGSTAILDTGAITLATLTGNKLWHFVGTATVQTSGASGKLIGQGQFTYNQLITDILNTAQASIDTTTSLVADLTAQFGTASASNTIVCTNVMLEVLN